MKEFKGECKGVRLIPRGTNDNHICIEILTEDDEDWFVSKNPFSSHWIDDLIFQLQTAKRWMEEHEKPDMHTLNKTKVQFGWKFK